MHKKDAFMFRSRICRFHFERDKLIGTDFVLCNVNDFTIPHVLTLCTSSSVSERGDMDSENHSVVIPSIVSHSVNQQYQE